MRHRVTRYSVALGLLSWFCVPAVAPAQSQVRIIAPASVAEVDGLLTKGRELEIDRRWADALTLYEDALRHYPNESSLAERADVAKLHYDLARRYGDSSFVRSLTLQEPEALKLFDEVLLKLQSHYVQTPNWQQLVDRGVRAMEIALADPTFVRQNLPRADADQVARFAQDLRATASARLIRERTEARDMVAALARLGRQQVGLAPAVTVLEFLCAATGGLDEYSTYLTGDQLNDLYAQIEGAFVGLGVELKAAEGTLLIVNVITGSPAQRGGIKPNDRVLSVSGTSTAGLTTDQAADLLQGEENSVVDLVVVTPGEAERTLRLRREHVDVPSVDDVKFLDEAAGVAYLKLTCFQKTTSRDLDAALWKLHREGMKSLIMDLRGNPGGLLTSSVEIADKFVEQGTIVSTRGRNPQEDFTYSAHRVGTWRVPLVVLIDGDSASASEIFAGAIRDTHRGTIVGVRSYGKGSVQGIFPLTTAGAGVRLTTAKFYSPTGQPYSRVGVQPDIYVRQAAKPIDGSTVVTASDEDVVLNAGLQAARRQVASR